MNNQNDVPSIITCKDLDYLSDMFEWNYVAYKKAHDTVSKVTDEQIKQMTSQTANIFEENMNEILDILSGGGQIEQ